VGETEYVKVYVDVILLVNFIMDYFILWATGKIINYNIKTSRIIVGAFFGATYSLVILFPEWPLLTSLFIKVLCSVFMICIAYGMSTIGKILKALTFMYLVSFAMGGTVIGAVYLLDSKPSYLQALNGVGILWGINYWWLIIAIIVAIFIGYGGFSCLKKNWLHQQLFNMLTINIKDNKTIIPALLDTGNQLSEPTTKNPVVVVEIDALKKIIPDYILNKVREDDNKIYDLVTSLDKEWSSRLSLIPFNSVGKNHGIMIGFRPDSIEIKSKYQNIIVSNVVLGLVNRSLSKEGKYRALLHPQIFQEKS